MGAVVARGGNAEEGTTTEERPYVEERDGSIGGGGSGVLRLRASWQRRKAKHEQGVVADMTACGCSAANVVEVGERRRVVMRCSGG